MNTKFVINAILVIIIVFNITNFLKENMSLYTEKFNPEIYRNLWGQSQYVTTTPTQTLPDEIVYSFAGWEYLHGVNPAVFNADQPPLGKYLIGLSEVWFGNPRIVGPLFNILCLIALYYLSYLILESHVFASGLIALFSFEKIFIVQMKYAPLLDNIQLFLILLSFIFFAKFAKSNKFLPLAFLSLGAVMSVKFWVTGVLIYIIWLSYLLILKNKKKVTNFFIYSPLILLTMMLSYLPAFFQGLSIRGFFGVQKYIYSFHSGKLNFDPIAVWDLLLFNRWHSFSGIRTAVDFQITWPILTLLSLSAVFYILSKKSISKLIGLIAIWFIVYIGLLSTSSILPRYLIPVLPAMYILSFWLIANFTRDLRSKYLL